MTRGSEISLANNPDGLLLFPSHGLPIQFRQPGTGV